MPIVIASAAWQSSFKKGLAFGKSKFLFLDCHALRARNDGHFGLKLVTFRHCERSVAIQF